MVFVFIGNDVMSVMTHVTVCTNPCIAIHAKQKICVDDSPALCVAE